MLLRLLKILIWRLLVRERGLLARTCGIGASEVGIRARIHNDTDKNKTNKPKDGAVGSNKELERGGLMGRVLVQMRKLWVQ